MGVVPSVHIDDTTTVEPNHWYHVVGADDGTVRDLYGASLMLLDRFLDDVHTAKAAKIPGLQLCASIQRRLEACKERLPVRSFASSCHKFDEVVYVRVDDDAPIRLEFYMDSGEPSAHDIARFLDAMELLGQYIFRLDPSLLRVLDMDHREFCTYRHTHPRHTGRAPPDQARWDRPTDVRPSYAALFETLLGCYWGMHGPVGLFWLFPLLYLLYQRDLGWPETPRVVDRAIPSDCVPTTTAPELCAHVPRGCLIDVHSYPTLRVDQQGLLVWLTSFQCQCLSRDADERRHPKRSKGSLRDARQNYAGYCGQNDRSEVVHVLTVAGIPAATAVATVDRDSDEAPSYLYVSLLCAAYRSGAGREMMRHLKTISGGRIELSAMQDAVSFYKRQGFTWSEGPYASHRFEPSDASTATHGVETTEGGRGRRTRRQAAATVSASG